MNKIKNLEIFLKKKFRRFYYYFNDGRIVQIKTPVVLRGCKWILSKNYGRAYSEGYYENDLLNALERYLKYDSIFFDVGGHAGYISLFASKIASAVYTFEPEIENYNFIKRTLKLNSIENVKSFNVAVGKERSDLFFKSGPTSSTGTISHSGTQKTNGICIDDFISDNQIKRLDVIKIDVEGYGGEVLRGMQKCLQQMRPVIFFEIHNADELNEIKKLSKLNYLVFNIDSTPVNFENLIDQFLIVAPR